MNLNTPQNTKLNMQFFGFNRKEVQRLFREMRQTIQQLTQEKEQLQDQINTLKTERNAYDKEQLNKVFIDNLRTVNQLVAAMQKVVGEEFQSLLDLQAFDKVVAFMKGQSTDWFIAAFQLMDLDYASRVTQEFSTEKQLEIYKRLSQTVHIHHQQIEDVLLQTKAHFAKENAIPKIKVDGVQQTIQMLYSMPRRQQQQSLNELARTNRQLHEQLMKKMFFYSDLQHLTIRDLQKVLRNSFPSDLFVAMKDETQRQIKELFIQSVSKRQAEEILEGIELLNPCSPAQIEAAQRNIAKTTTTLIEQEQIHFTRPT